MAALLIDLGVDVTNAPERALGEPGELLCGGEELGHDGLAGPGRNDTARRCFLDAHLAAIPAAFASSVMLPDGGPVVTVWFTGPAGVSVWYDATRDPNFGSGRWEGPQTCERLTTVDPEVNAPQPPTAFDCVDGRNATEPAPQVPAEIPDWFTERPELPLCGVAVRIDDVDEAERQCFIDARDAGEPAEFAHLSFGDEGERQARWFRSLGDGTFEVLESQASADGTKRTWYRYECSQLTYYEDVESQAWQLPTIESTCTQVESSPPDAPLAPPSPPLVDPYAPCLGPPELTLRAGTERMVMDVINYSESSDDCGGLSVDGDAMFDDAFRPAIVLIAPDGQLVLAADRAGYVSADIQPLLPRIRLAAVDANYVSLAAVANGTYPVTLPGPGCFVVTVTWNNSVGSGGYTALAESEFGLCAAIG